MNSEKEMVALRCIINRKTGEMMTVPVPVFKEDVSFQDVDLGGCLMRYMDLYKFESLLKHRALYFCRVDKFKDSLEGSVSAKGIHGTSPSDIAWKKEVPMDDDDYEKQKLNENCAKGCTFVNCWYINKTDSMKMWDSYTSSPESILVDNYGETSSSSVENSCNGGWSEIR